MDRLWMLIKPLVAACISSCAAKRNARNAMPVAGIAEAKSSAEGPLVSAQPILRLELKLATGGRYRHWSPSQASGSDLG